MKSDSSPVADGNDAISGGLSKLQPSVRRWLGRSITAIQIVVDFLTIAASFLVAYWFYVGPLSRTSPQTFAEFSVFTAASAVLYLLILDRVGIYRREISLLNIQELRGIIRAAVYSSAAILAISFYIRTETLSRITLTVAMLLAPIALIVQRRIFYQLHILFHAKGWSGTKLLVFGTGSVAEHLCRRLLESPGLGLLPVGFLDDDASRAGQTISWPGMRRAPLRIFGGAEHLAQAKKAGVNFVLIARPDSSFERNQKLVEACTEAGIEYAIVPNAYESFIQGVELFEIGGVPVLRRRKHRVSIYYLALKRIFDFAVAAAFLVLFLPLLLIFGIFIKLDSPGPLIFKQKRVGLNGREFSFYKFRSMAVDAPKYAFTPTESNDPRITRLGRFLRRTSLDELPQLFNVLRGDMSLVGPRPEMPFIVAGYSQLQRQRLEAKPGITGLWQISTFRGAPIHQHIEYDLFYLENRSLLLDFVILAKTALSVVRGVGAV